MGLEGAEQAAEARDVDRDHHGSERRGRGEDGEHGGADHEAGHGHVGPPHVGHQPRQRRRRNVFDRKRELFHALARDCHRRSAVARGGRKVRSVG